MEPEYDSDGDGGDTELNDKVFHTDCKLTQSN